MERLLLTNTTLRTSRQTIENCSIICDEGLVVRISEKPEEPEEHGRVINCAGLTVTPGFIDLHVHGFGGRDSREGSLDAIEAMAQTYTKFGVTSLLITLTVLSAENLQKSAAAVSQAANQTGLRANVLGVHLEGPFLNPKYKGGIFGGGLTAPSIDVLREYAGYCNGTLRNMTLAPELDGSEAVIDELLRKGIIPSMGHSGATYEEARRAISQGCKYAVHLFNGMPPIAGRDPGIAGAALYEHDCCVELIADGHHVSIANVLAALKLKPSSKICLVTDSCRASGTDLSGFDNPSGFHVEIRDGRTWGPEGKLVGSVLTLDAAVRNLLAWSPLTLNEVLSFVTENPAIQLGLYPKKGDIRPGSDADITILDRTNSVVHTIVGGRLVYSR